MLECKVNISDLGQPFNKTAMPGSRTSLFQCLRRKGQKKQQSLKNGQDNIIYTHCFACKFSCAADSHWFPVVTTIT